MTLDVLVVDDEPPARERLCRLLAEIETVKVVGEARDGVQALEMIEALSPDLVLLDIQMPGLDGFGVIQALDAPPLIIFVTAYDEYAIRAFEVHALDYLLKPFSRERLKTALRRAEERLAGVGDPGVDPAQGFSAQLAPLLERLAAQGHYLTRLAVRDREGVRVLDAREVDWIGVEGEQVIVHVGERAFPIRRTLADLEARLDPAQFFRAHRSAIVNLDRVQKIIPWFKGSHKLELTTGVEVDLSRAQARALRNILGW
jgi:two-component system LytT family response regulator